MSLICCIFTFDGIIIAADKRIIDKQTNAVITDTETKLFLCGNRIAISFCGDADVNGIPVRTHIKRFLSEYPSPKSTHELAFSIRNFMRSINPNCSINFLIAGYQGGRRSVYEVSTTSQIETEHIDNDITSGIVYHGETSILKALIGSEEIMWTSFTLHDAANFASFAINITNRMMSFQKRPCTVSSSYDLLLITEKGAKFLTSNPVFPQTEHADVFDVSARRALS